MNRCANHNLPVNYHADGTVTHVSPQGNPINWSFHLTSCDTNTIRRSDGTIGTATWVTRPFRNTTITYRVWR